MSEGAEHFLTSLYVRDAFAVRDIEVPIAQGEDRRRHLMLTGPNGSGKSSVLDGVHRGLATYPQSPEAGAGSNIKRLDGRPLVELEGLPDLVDRDGTILAYMRASRTLELQRPAGPTRLEEKRFLRSEGAAGILLQFLVNLRTEQALAREDGDDAAADHIGRRFQGIEGRLRQILDDDEAHLRFDRASFDFRIVLGDGRVVDFDKLPDGIASILFMWATLMIPAEAILRTGISDPAGWAIIDEPELHLHARLQEMVLPFLITMFPNVQFIVATHSPAVLASIPDATIFDLRSREAIPSADLQGIRYGTILTEHFGIETDFDLDTTRKLGRLERLSDADRGP